ncbi:cyclic peptide export ABC transporter [Thalassomonas sp. RHCl1]|uniref:cyclic peptide export ABC transporter n=1 Tax=Thalassomonas sp. RHCl1 TaxID=2995320 RepID=UPI00248B4891|nr:cyclic peptide export ABC transporter [Thalassomonas sp. RHCl1]
MNIAKQLLQKSKYSIALAIFASAISAATGVAIIGGINYALSNGLPDFTLGVTAYIGLLVLLLASSIWSQVLLVKIGYTMVYRLRKSLVARILNTSIERQEQLGGPAIYNVLTRDVTMLSNATKQLPVAIYNSLLVIAGLIYLCWLSPLLFAFVALVVVIGVWSDAKLTASLQKMLTRIRHIDEELFQQYEAVVEGRNELALNSNRRRFLLEQQLIPTAEASRDESVKSEVLWSLNLNWTTLLVFTLMGVIFFAGMQFPSISQETVVAYILAIMFLRTPISMVLDSIPSVLKGKVALAAINRLTLEDKDELPVRDKQATPKFQSLALKDAVYQYPAQDDEAGFCLGAVNLNINAGELVFLVGGNGSGKSTLAKILTGLYQPTSGEVLLNNKPVGAENAGELRGCFSAIFPNFFLFNEVIDEQGNSDDHPKIDYYLKRLAIDHKVSVDKGQLSTTALSQGQRKRLALMLLYMEDRQVLLLDEWAADQDPVFREVFYREILPELKQAGKTIIAISHDDHYFDCADHIYKLDCGQLSNFNTGQQKLFATS